MILKHVLLIALALMVTISLGCGPRQSPQASQPAADPPEEHANPPEEHPNPPASPDSPATAPSKSPTPDVDTAAHGPGVGVGETVSIELKDQSGKVRTLPELAGDGLVALVFHRSADW